MKHTYLNLFEEPKFSRNKPQDGEKVASKKAIFSKDTVPPNFFFKNFLFIFDKTVKDPKLICEFIKAKVSSKNL